MSIDVELAIAEAVRGRPVAPSGWIRFNCPMCELRHGKADRKQSAGLNARSMIYSCFKCDSKGRLRHAPDEYDLPPLEEETAEVVHYIDPPPEFVELGSDEGRDNPFYEPAWEYLTRATDLGGRGMTEERIMELGIGACLEGDYRGRVILPVRENNVGAWQWFVGRAWRKKHWFPYKYPSGQRHGVLFNEVALALETDEPVLLVEGWFDAASLWPDGVAALGKTTDDVIATLTRSKRPVVLVPDGDAWEENLAACYRLQLAGLRAGCLKLPPRKDPDEFPADYVRAKARESITE